MALLAVAGLAACRPAEDAQTAVNQSEEPVPACGANGYLSGEIYGAIRTTLDWGPDDLVCEGMPRPEGHGVRLRFAGQANAGERSIAIIIAMPGFSRDMTPAEFPANVTLIKEGDARFFSTPDLDNCLCDIDRVDETTGAAGQVRVTGTLYCVAPLPEVNGDSSVLIPELRFSGLLDWDGS